MKKFMLINIMLILLLLVSSCTNAAKISKDYSKIIYDNKEYELYDHFIVKPDDAVEVYSSKSLLISYDVIYLSESWPDFLWLDTSTDSTENEKFESVLTGNTVVYKIVE